MTINYTNTSLDGLKTMGTDLFMPDVVTMAA